MMCGGIGEQKDADAEIQQIIEMENVKSAAAQKSGKTFATYKAVSYKSQVVAGTNFFVKVDIGNSEFIHLRVFRPLPHTGEQPSLSDVQVSKNQEDAIEYF